MNILYISSEAQPFIASGGLADVAGSLPKALNKLPDVECHVVLPLYSDIKPEMREKITYVTNFLVDVSWRKQYCGLFKAEADGVTYYFLDNEYYFSRPGLYGYYDDAERFAFFSRGVLEMLRYLPWKPDILHANDWQSALVPVYYDSIYKYQPEYAGMKTIFTIHNIAYQGKYGKELLREVWGIPESMNGVMEYDQCVNLMKAAIQLSYKVTTVSPTYAQEILDPWYAHGLDRILRDYQFKLCGILNGIDTDLHNPETDTGIAAQYSVRAMAGKKKDKLDLLQEVGLPADPEAPVIGIVSRLVAHKGIDLIQCVFEDIINAGFRVVILGSGDCGYEHFFSQMRDAHPDQVATILGFIPALAKKIYAGADIFLMPSQSEPCGLAQMIALRYGTIPVVRETGGLKDSVFDCSLGEGNGFTFANYNAHEMLDALYRAKGVYENKKNWRALVRYAMKCDYSWTRSADAYLGLYNEVMSM